MPTPNASTGRAVKARPIWAVEAYRHTACAGGARIGIPRRNRLRYRSDFLRLRETGQRWAHPVLVLNAAPSNQDQVRVGIVVSRKVARKAVHRNRLKRRLREILRPWLPYLRPGWDLVIVARPPAQQAAFEELREILWQLITQADLWQELPPPPLKRPPQAPQE